MSPPRQAVDRGLRARQVAFEALAAVERGARSDAALARRLADSGLDARDRALATRLVYGTLAWQRLLDWHIDRLARRPKVDGRVRIVLRMALFQLGRLDRVPAHAAVDTAVRLCRLAGGSRAAGFVNAVLRRWQREGANLDAGLEEGAGAAHLGLRWSHPDWLVERWLEELGPEEAVALLAADQEPAATALRVRRGGAEEVAAALAAAGIGARPSRWVPAAVRLDAGADPLSLPQVVSGQCAVQGEASQLVVALVGARPGDRVLDACAAPGGKTLALADAVGGEGRVVAVDPNPRAMAALRDAVGRAGGGVVEPVVSDLLQWEPGAQSGFDAVLVDAPCSGLGTLRQHPEIRWRQNPGRIRELAALQARLLERAARHVRPGGALVYATCTISRAENEEVVRAFLARHPEWRPGPAPPTFPAAAAELAGDDGFLRTFPHRHGLDGFFAARLVRSPAHPAG